MAEVDRASQGQTQLVAELRDYGKRSALFAPQDFHYDHQALTLTCPNGVTSTRFYRQPSADGWTVRFLRNEDGCATCPLLRKCYQKLDTQRKRDVFMSDYTQYAVLALIDMTSETFRAEMRQRAAVERIIAALVRYNDARRARRRGRVAVDFQVKMAATVYNLRLAQTPYLGGVCLVVGKRGAERSKRTPGTVILGKNGRKVSIQAGGAARG